MKMNIELHPCRYCGGEAVIKEYNWTNEYDEVEIQCLRCGVTLRRTQDYLMIQKEDPVSGFVFWERAGAINKSAVDIWNGCLLKGEEE